MSRKQIAVTHEMLVQKFWELVAIRSDGECWEWQGRLNWSGYGILCMGKRCNPTFHEERAHRFCYRIHNALSKVPKGLHVCHRCDNPKCVNPKHLFLGTDLDNMRDKCRKGRQPKGEEYAKRLREWIPRGSRRSNAKLTETDIRTICEMRERGMFYKDIAKHFGVHKQTVCSAALGRTWKHIERPQ
jgi:hypothetical protein